MSCRRCPHHVRHGQVEADNSIVFRDRCGLKMKEEQECQHVPFPKFFNYQECEVYRATFRTKGQRNDVVPTRDFQYSPGFVSSSITDMELL